MAQTINTVIVLRNDKSTAWEKSEYVLLEGEVGIGYLDNGNVIAKLGDGKTSWSNLPQIEGILEKDLILTYNFGRHTVSSSKGFVNAGGAGMTTREWLEDALSETKEPNIIQPTFTLNASATGVGGEIGSYLTALTWDGSTTYGLYEYGPATGLGESNRTWAISNSIDTQTSTKEDGTFTLSDAAKIQLTQENSKTYATITGTYTLDVSGATTPVNNVGAETTGKITGPASDPTKITDTIVANVNATAYRKPFWAVLKDGKALDMTTDADGKLTAIASDDIRGLATLDAANGTGGSGTKTKGFPSSIAVAKGSQMVIFAAKAGTYSSLTATDDKAQNATVSFEKKANAIRVKGANNFVTAATGDAANGELYDVWFVDWGAGVEAAKQLTLIWS